VQKKYKRDNEEAMTECGNSKEGLLAHLKIVGRSSMGSFTKKSIIRLGFTHDKARAHKGGMRIGSKKLDSFCCPQHREINAGEGDQEQEKRLV
jgi:hypothetical protein